MACLNKSRTLAAPMPTNISTNSEPDIEKNGTFASPATALASRVLPVPGGPTSSTPLGILAPILVYLSGLCKKSTTSRSASLASSSPSTSAKVLPVWDSMYILALDLPNCMALPAAPPMRFIMNAPSAVNSNIGNTHEIRNDSIGDCWVGISDAN